MKIDVSKKSEMELAARVIQSPLWELKDRHYFFNEVDHAFIFTEKQYQYLLKFIIDSYEVDYDSKN
jgi:hypothetical protein